MSPSTYNKPFLTVDQQLAKLSSRGLTWNDRDAAYDTLRAIGYYRLSGYWHPFRQHAMPPATKRPSDFVPGTTLKDVIAIYRFDEKLRAEVLRVLARIEVAVRFQVGHTLGQRGAFAHNDVAHLNPDWTTPRNRTSSGPACSPSCTWTSSNHHQWMLRQNHNEEISNEAFTAHIHGSYGKPLPVWTATEVMTFGDLNRLFGGLTQRDRQEIAAAFDLFSEDGNGDAATLASWLDHLRITRNYAAHHARLWNRNHPAPLKVPSTIAELAHLSEEATDSTRPLSLGARRLYGTLALLAFLSARIDPTNDSRDALVNLIIDHVGGDADKMKAMGFPDGWGDLALWSAEYRRDTSRASQAALLRSAELLYDADASSCLMIKDSHKERKRLLKYYRTRGAALSVPGVVAHRFPAFQFDKPSGDLHPLAVLANRRLLGGTGGTEEQRWNAVRWWFTPVSTLPDGVSPRTALADSTLERHWLDIELPPREDE